MIRTTPHLNEGKASELLKTKKQIRNKSPSAQSPSDPQAFLFLSAIYSNICSMKMCVWYIKQSSGYIVFLGRPTKSTSPGLKAVLRGDKLSAL